MGLRTLQVNTKQITRDFKEILKEYDICQNISSIITDNAANMTCAFEVQMLEKHSDESEKESGQRVNVFPVLLILCNSLCENQHGQGEK